MKTRTKILIATIGIISTIVLILSLNHLREKEEISLKEYLLLNITNKVCYMPKACFDSEQKFKEQFPYGYVLENYPECLIYCYSQEEKQKIINSGLFPIR